MGRVVLHIGVMKTGTTFLQAVLQGHPEQLRAAGFTYLGGSFGAQARAVRELLAGRPARWERLVEKAREDDRTSVVSMEFLSFARNRQVATALAPLEGLTVDVVLTVRDEFSAIPAQWQTYCRNFGTEDFRGYLRAIEREPGKRGGAELAHRTFRRAQDVPAILARWQRSPLVSSVRVVTVPGPGSPPDELWNRFCAAAGIPVGAVDSDVREDNTSLGFGSCDFLRRANRWLQDVPPAQYRAGMRPMARTVLAPLRDSQTKPRLDRRAAGHARDLNARIRQALAEGGYELHGSVEDLPVPADLSAYPRRAPRVPRAEVRAAAEAVRAYAADLAGVEAGPAPRRLGRLVRETAGMLASAHEWDERSVTLPR